MSERELAAIFEGMLHAGGWSFFHPYDARRSQTILDYYCWKDRAFWAELKTMRGRLSVDRWVKDRYGRRYFIKGQVTVAAELRAAGQEVHVFSPSDYEAMCRVLGLPVE